MNEHRGLILDANILLRAIFGRRVRQLLEKYEDEARFYTPDGCFQDAQRYVPIVSKDRGLDADLGLSVLDQLARVVERVDRSSTRNTKVQLAHASSCGIRTIGPWSPQPYYSIYRFGPRIRIFLAAASPPGQLIEWNSTFNNDDLLSALLQSRTHSLYRPTPRLL